MLPYNLGDACSLPTRESLLPFHHFGGWKVNLDGCLSDGLSLSHGVRSMEEADPLQYRIYQ